MKKIIPTDGKAEPSSREQLLKDVFGALHASPERVEETIALAKARSRQNEHR